MTFSATDLPRLLHYTHTHTLVVPLDNGTLDILSKLEKDGGFDGLPREKRAAHAAGS